mmetsp:Transcript_12526/g.29409  ORF Transcript_12526/g.29409 Transcript_12526/m.29409 type:complete len:907 (+) Transcript_12526:47-2767(+)
MGASSSCSFNHRTTVEDAPSFRPLAMTVGPCAIDLPSEGALDGSCIVENLQQAEISTIEFLTDVEGNWDYFLRWVNLCQTLYWHGPDLGVYGPGRLHLKAGCALVFGGDATDKGPGDIRFVRTLLDLKARYKHRVFIVLGNRDINKLRFSAELVPGVAPFVLPWDQKALSRQEWLDGQKELSADLVGTTKWMLHFMGCQNTTFNTRRHELALLNPGATITDEDVAWSFYGSVDPAGPDPWELRLVQSGQLLVLLGDNLFVHGGVHENALGHVPGKSKAPDLKSWVRGLNQWKDQQVRDFISRPHWQQKGAERTRGAEDLILYGTPGIPGQKSASVVYHNPFNDGNPQLYTEVVQTYLEDNGVRRVISGHQPHGQSPTIVRHPGRTPELFAVSGDTSYSCPEADKLHNPADMRGSAVSVVRVIGDILEIEGFLADGKQHGCRLEAEGEKEPDNLVGRQMNDGSWVKTVIGELGTARDNVQTVLGQGHKLCSQEVHYQNAILRLDTPFKIGACDLRGLDAAWLKQHTAFLGINAGAEEDPRPINYYWDPRTKFDKEEFYSAETFIFNLGGVVQKVRDPEDLTSGAELPPRSYTCATIMRTASATGWPGTDKKLEARIIDKINGLINKGKRLIFLSNNSHNSRKQVAEDLVRSGIKLPVERLRKYVLNTSYTCAWFVQNRGLKKPFVLCSDTGILEELEAVGIKNYVATVSIEGETKEEYLQAANYENVIDLVTRHPDVDSVVVGWDRQLTTLKIAVASAYLNWITHPAKIPLITCSSDAGGILGSTAADFLFDRHFNNRQVRTAGNGLMARIVADTAGSGVTYYDVGQPSDLVLEALHRKEKEHGLAVDPKKAVLIGDTLSTDIALANRGGMRSLLVFSGETDKEKFMSMDLDPAHRPTWVANSFADT